MLHVEHTAGASEADMQPHHAPTLAAEHAVLAAAMPASVVDSTAAAVDSMAAAGATVVADIDNPSLQTGKARLPHQPGLSVVNPKPKRSVPHPFAFLLAKGWEAKNSPNPYCKRTESSSLRICGPGKARICPVTD
jgi:hypothetical protein